MPKRMCASTARSITCRSESWHLLTAFPVRSVRSRKTTYLALSTLHRGSVRGMSFPNCAAKALVSASFGRWRAKPLALGIRVPAVPRPLRIRSWHERVGRMLGPHPSEVHTLPSSKERPNPLVERTRNSMAPRSAHVHSAHRGAMPLRSAHRERYAPAKTSCAFSAAGLHHGSRESSRARCALRACAHPRSG